MANIGEGRGATTGLFEERITKSVMGDERNEINYVEKRITKNVLPVRNKRKLLVESRNKRSTDIKKRCWRSQKRI